MNKAELIKKSEEHQEAIEREMQDLVTEGKSIGRTAAYVAGGLLASYFVIRLITRKKVVINDESELANFQAAVPKKNAGIWSGLGRIVLTEVAMMGLQLAKERIKDVLNDEGPEAKSE